MTNPTDAQEVAEKEAMYKIFNNNILIEILFRVKLLEKPEYIDSRGYQQQAKHILYGPEPRARGSRGCIVTPFAPYSGSFGGEGLVFSALGRMQAAEGNVFVIAVRPGLHKNIEDFNASLSEIFVNAGISASESENYSGAIELPLASTVTTALTAETGKVFVENLCKVLKENEFTKDYIKDNNTEEELELILRILDAQIMKLALAESLDNIIKSCAKSLAPVTCLDDSSAEKVLDEPEQTLNFG